MSKKLEQSCAYNMQHNNMIKPSASEHFAEYGIQQITTYIFFKF